MDTPNKQRNRVGEAKSSIVRELPRACSDESAAVDFFESRRWGNTPTCARCESSNVYQMADAETGERSARFLWRCRDCKKQYTVKIGTVMEDSRIPLRHWAYGFWAVCSSKKGVSAKQIQRMTGLSYKSALFMLHRIRFALSPGSDAGKLTGTVEVDETFIGGKPRKVTPQRPGAPSVQRRINKQIVLGALSRDTGEVRAQVIPSVTRTTLQDAVTELVDESASLNTDAAMQYRAIGKRFASHQSVIHTGPIETRYVRDGVTVNSIEGFFSILKRGIYGVYHNVSKEHLQRYVDEFEFRYNTRKLDDGGRVEAAIRGSVGRRLVREVRTG